MKKTSNENEKVVLRIPIGITVMEVVFFIGLCFLYYLVWVAGTFSTTYSIVLYGTFVLINLIILFLFKKEEAKAFVMEQLARERHGTVGEMQVLLVAAKDLMREMALNPEVLEKVKDQIKELEEKKGPVH